MMRHLFSIINVVFLLLLESICSAKVVDWSIKPEYDSLKPYSDGVFYCEKNSRWGLVSTAGKEILPPKYDFISSMIDGYAIAGIKTGKKNKICAIISDSFKVTKVVEDYYLVNNQYTYFSEGKMPVADKSGKKGYIDRNGNLVVKCRFGEAHPFSNGLASVSRAKRVFYITANYDKNPRNNVLLIDFNHSELTFGSTFHNDSAVVAYNGKAAVVNSYGEVLGKYIDEISVNKFDHKISSCGSKSKLTDYVAPEEDRSITVFSVDGQYGFREGDKVVVHPVFDYAEPFLTNGCSLVRYKQKAGLVKLLDGDIKFSIVNHDDESDVSELVSAKKDGSLPTCQYSLKIPFDLDHSGFKIFLNYGTSGLQEVQTRSLGDRLVAEFTPVAVDKNADSLTIKSEVLYYDLPVLKSSSTFNLTRSVQQVKKKVSLIIIGPAAQTERADEKDTQVIYSAIRNKGDVDVRVKATLSVKEKNMVVTNDLNIPASGQKTVSVSIPNVIKNEQVTATITLSNGDNSTKKVSLKTYY